MQDGSNARRETLLALTADIVAAHVTGTRVEASALPALIGEVHATLARLTAPATPADTVRRAPAVAIRSSVKSDHIVCLEDGRKLKMLKRYLRVHYDLTPEAYRRRWNLPVDYPMVAPDYAEKRRTLAHAIGLGRKDSHASRPRKANA